MVCAGITYNAGTNTITVVYNAADGGRGTQADPFILFVDMYDTDVHNGWGVVSKQGTQFYITALVSVGGTAYVQDSNKQVMFYKATAGHVSILTIYGCILFDNIAFYRSLDSVPVFSLFFLPNSLLAGWNVVENCSFSNFWLPAVPRNILYKNCSFIKTGGSSLRLNGDGVTHEYLSILEGAAAFDCLGQPAAISNISIFNCSTAIKINTTTANKTYDFYNVGAKLRNRGVAMEPSSSNTVLNLHDCLFDAPAKYSIHAYGTITGDITLNYLSTFKAEINTPDVNIELRDKDDTLIYSGGELDQYVIYNTIYAETVNGAVTADIDTTYEPFTITITKEGYQDLTISDITVTPGEPTIIRGELVEVEPPIYYQQNLKGSISCPTLKGVIKTPTIKGTIKTC